MWATLAFNRLHRKLSQISLTTLLSKKCRIDQRRGILKVGHSETDEQNFTKVVVLYVRPSGQYFFYKTYFKPKIHKTITIFPISKKST